MRCFFFYRKLLLSCDSCDIYAKVKIKIDNMLTSVHFFTQFITIVVNIYGQTELKHPILLRGNNKKARLGMRGVLEGSTYC